MKFYNIYLGQHFTYQLLCEVPIHQKARPGVMQILQSSGSFMVLVALRKVQITFVAVRFQCTYVDFQEGSKVVQCVSKYTSLAIFSGQQCRASLA